MKALRTAGGALLLVTQTACALHPRVELLGPGDYAALNERAAPRPALILMRDGNRVGARGLVLDERTATWTDAGTGAPTSAPLTEIAEVRLRNETGRATAIGGTWGFLIGAGIGAFLGLVSSDNDEGEVFETTPLADALIVGTVIGALGWVIGLPVGAIKGTDDVYRMPPPPQGAQDRLLEGGSAKP